MKYSDVETWLKPKLAIAGFNPVFNPGPFSDTTLQKRSPNAMVFLQVGGGAGLNTENLFDQPFIIVRSIGNQHDYGNAEDQAQAIDTLFNSVVSNTVIGTAKVLYIVRTGGAPQVVQCDTADRYHFQCTYITNTQTGW